MTDKTILDAQSIARLIDHTLLKPEATRAQIADLCAQAREYRFASVCVNPAYVRYCSQLLDDVEDVAVCTVIGFPLGANTSEIKAIEAEHAIADGATEVDMVINVGALKSHDKVLVQRDIAAVVEVAHKKGAICKVIIETALLNDDEKVEACQLAMAAGADFVKTSTGFSSGGATAVDVAMMRRTVGSEMGVKASGGVRTLDDVRAMVEAGATRIGASAGVAIVQELLGSSAAADPGSDY